MEQNLELAKIKQIAKKQKWWLIFPFFLTFIPVVVVAFVLPEIFRSSAVILIENPRVPPNLVPSTVTSFADQRIQSMTQEATSRTRILNLVAKYNLLPDKRDVLPTEDVVDRVQKRINVQPIDAEIKKESQNKPILLTIAFKLSYEDESPSKAQKVTNELTSYYMEKNLEDREKHARTTSKFLQEQMQQAKVRVSELESKLADYREQHLEELPEFTTLNMQKLDKLNADISNLNMQVRSMEEQRSVIKGKLSSLDPLSPSERVLSYDDRIQQAQLELAGLTSKYSKKHPAVQAKNQEITVLERKGDQQGGAKLRDQLRSLELELADLKSRYTDKHPAVQSKVLEVERVRKEVEALPVGQQKAQKPKAVVKERLTNPIYVSLKTDLEKLDISVESARGEIQRFEKMVAEVYDKLRSMPRVSKEYNELMTDYQNAKNQFTDLQVKFSSAQVAQGMEEEQLGETFHVVEPPFLPEKPVKPNRMAIIVIGFIAGLGIALGCATLVEFMDNSIQNVEGLEQITGLRVWTVIPSILTREELAGKRRKKMILVAGSMVAIILIIVAFHFWVMDLHVLFAKVERRLQRFF
ncbi:MAG: hypothetical protein LLG06_16005 [Desulfobacteraceae bacterium]|nr:hypothetical protein [Desulfobacteraceae bacterium]